MGSEEGGARVTVRGVGFGNKQLTPQVGSGGSEVSRGTPIAG